MDRISPMVCKLCLQDKPLANSHIIPKFVGKWLKDSSATGYLRCAENPNVRKQDLPTQKLLCYDCENLFSQWENAFAKEIFLPFQENNKIKFKYDVWLLKFAISIVWRIGVVKIDNFRSRNSYLSAKIDEALEYWRNFLLGNSTLNEYEHHLLFLDVIADTQSEIPVGFHWYTLRGTDATIVSNDQHVFIYGKIPGMIFFSSVHPLHLQGWEKTKIHQRGHMSAGKQKIKDEIFGNFLLDRAQKAMTVGGSLSSRQEQKIVDALLENPERTNNSKTLVILEIEQLSIEERIKRNSNK